MDLASKTRLLVQESATQEGLGRLTKTATFDVSTLKTLRSASGSDAAKVFNLVRGFRQEIEHSPDKEPVLLPLKERAESILKELENRQTTGLAAMGSVGRPRRGKGCSPPGRTGQRPIASRVRRPLGTQGRRQAENRWHRHLGAKHNERKCCSTASPTRPSTPMSNDGYARPSMFHCCDCKKTHEATS